ncbi:ATP-binding protein [Chloroflexota bacterium]
MTIWALLPLITCLTYITLFALTIPSREKRINKIFAFHLGVAATWSFTSFMLHLNLVPEQAMFWNGMLTVALVWTLITYYHFIRTYANKPAGKGVYLGYVFLLALVVLSMKGYIVQYSYVIDGMLYYSLGIAMYFIGAICLTYTGAGIILLVKKYRSASDLIDRNRTIYLMAGWCIVILSGYTNLIPPMAGFPFDHIGSLANAIIIAYAIRKYKLLDIRLVIRKGLVYSSLTIFLTTLYLLLLFSLQMFFHGWFGYSSLALAAGFALMAALLFNPLRNLIQNWIDHLFYRETYDYRQMLLSFSNKISNVLDLGELAQNILDPLVKAMHVKRAALLFPEVESGDFNSRFVQQTTKEDPFTKLKFSSDNPVVSWLVTEGKALRRELIDIIPQFKGLWEVERIALNALGVELLCPIRSKGNLIGILALGKKESESAYSDEETDLLMTMANEAAMVVENARMLDSLKSQQLQVEQLLAQVVLAQEEERNRISIDLHDSVAQWLVAASYGIQSFNHALSGDKADRARDDLATMENTITKSLKELRRVVVGLRPPALDELGLTHAVRKIVEELKADGIDYKFTETGMPFRLPSSMEIAVYRIVQEALSNIRKHSNAGKVNLRMQFHGDRLVLEIRDNGQGFDLSQTLNSAISGGHLGLLGMRQRVEMLGGDIRIKTSEGKGTTITLSLPIQSPVKER